MKITSSFRFALAAIWLVGMSMGLQAQCVDMTTMDDGNKRFINVDLKQTSYVPTPTGPKVEYSWVISSPPETHPRHTLMKTAGTDALCKELSVLPPNHPTSIRLLNDGYSTLDSAKGEWMGFVIDVDADNAILLLDYAAVMENQQHSSASAAPNHGQPNCGFFIFDGEMDANGNIKRKKAYQHYISQSATMKGWKTFNNAERGGIQTYWKDWSVVGIDVSEYIGKRITFILENLDCAVKDIPDPTHVELCFDRHESHMYAHVSCAPKKLFLNKDCTGEEDSVFITAPEGFSYRWYNKLDKETTLSTERIYKGKADTIDVTYCCELTNYIGSFTLEQEVGGITIVDEAPVSLGFGQIYTWDKNGKTYRVSGVYEDTVLYTDTSYHACAKTIYRLPLTVAELNCPGTFKVIDSICGDARGLKVAFHYDEQYDTSDETKTDTIQPSVYSFKVDFPDAWNHQDSMTIQVDETTTLLKKGYKDITKEIVVDDSLMNGTITIPLPLDSVVNENGETVYAYPRPDTYTMNLIVKNQCNQEETFKLQFTVLYPAHVIYQRWNDVLAVHNERYNGGYTVRSVRWYRNGAQETALGEHGGYIRRTDLVDDIVPYWAEITREDDGKTFCTCRFTPAKQDVVDKPVFKEELSVAPRRNSPRQLQVTAATSGQCRLYDLGGRLLQTALYGPKYGSPDVVIAPSVAAGTYILHFLSEEGDNRAAKIVVE